MATCIRLLTQVVPHLFNRRRFAEFADIDVHFVWTGLSPVPESSDTPLVP